MNKKFLAAALSVAMVVPFAAACGNEDKGPNLTEVDNIAFTDGVVSFDKVTGATGYNVTFMHGTDVVYEDTLTDTSIDVESLGLEGNIKLTIAATAGKKVGPSVDYSFSVLSTFGDVELEAEDYLRNYGTGKGTSNYRDNPLAHKGSYVGGIDDAGQGVYIDYLCPVAGTYDFDCYYTTAMNPAHNDVWVNGVFAAKYDFTDNTGWGGATYDASVATVKITLKKGWNTICVMKNGDQSDTWGSFCELDYFVLKGDGSKYNKDELTAQYGVRPEAFRLEAEMGSPRHANSEGITTVSNPCAGAGDGSKYSNGFIMGNIESKYDGVEWHFNSPVRAKYRVKIAYTSVAFEGSKKPKPTFFVTQGEIGLSKNVRFDEMGGVTMAELPYTESWESVTVSEATVDIILEKGKNFIYCLKMDDCGLFMIDYVEVSFVEELEELPAAE